MRNAWGLLVVSILLGCTDPPAPGHVEISIAAFNPGELEIASISLEPTRLEVVHSETPEGERHVLELATDIEPATLRVSDSIRPVSVGAAPVPPGFIHQLRLITPDGIVHTRISPDGEILTIPSGTQTGIKATPASGEPFPVFSNRITSIEVLLNASEEIHAPGCGYDASRGACRADPPPRGSGGRETPGGNHVFPDYILHPDLPTRLAVVSGEVPPQFAQDQLFVMFERGTDATRLDALGTALGATIIRRSSLGYPWITYLLPSGSDVRAAARTVAAESDVRAALPNYSVQFMNEVPSELQPENQLPGFEYDPWWLAQIDAFGAWDDLASARGEPFRHGARSASVAVLDQSAFPYTPDLQDARLFNANELPLSVQFDSLCRNLGAGSAVVLLGEDNNGDGTVNGLDWDVNLDGGVTLADFNETPYRERINDALNTLNGTLRTVDQPIVMEDLIRADGMFGTTPRCGLFEDTSDGVLGTGDGNSLQDDLIGWNFWLESNWLFVGPRDHLLFPRPDQTLHQTKVEGFLAAAVNDRTAVGGALELESYVGVAPGVGVLAVPWIDPDSDDIVADTFIDRMTDAIQYAVDNNASIINASWSVICAPPKDGVPEDLQCDDEFRAEKFVQLGDVFTELEANGLDQLLFVTGGNNYAVDLDREDVQNLPGELGRPYMLRVAGSDREDRIAPRRTTGTMSHDVAGPSNELVSLSALGRMPGTPGLVFDVDGTEVSSDQGGVSFAIPMVAGTAALMLSVCPSLQGQPALLRERLLAGADCGLGDLNGRVAGGCRLNVRGAVRAVLPEFGGTCP